MVGQSLDLMVGVKERFGEQPRYVVVGRRVVKQ
jgi:hypothetical protein